MPGKFRFVVGFGTVDPQNFDHLFWPSVEEVGWMSTPSLLWIRAIRSRCLLLLRLEKKPITCRSDFPKGYFCRNVSISASCVISRSEMVSGL